MMEIDELKEKALRLSAVLTTQSKDNVECITIEDYVLKTFRIDKSVVEDSAIFHSNFIYLTCHLIRDIIEIEGRLTEYKTRYKSIQSDKSNEAEFERRKLIYFCNLNKAALKEINSFMANGMKEFLVDLRYDALKRECKRDGLSDLLLRGRYKYAWYKDYYSIDYPYGLITKVIQYAREKYSFEKAMAEEQRLLKLHSNSPDQFWRIMDQYVEQENVMGNILERVSENYHLHKRQEIFETLSQLFAEKKYQSFVTLGIIQIEGLFDDYCLIKYGEAKNAGTLIEKVYKTLETNEYNLLRMYPYFAFDVPLLRNEAAHKGMLKTEDAQRMAYDLVLDLNTLSQMVKSESYEKFIYAIMTHEKLAEWKPKENGDADEMYDTLLHELLAFDKMANEHFWKLIRDPDEYTDEMDFYRGDNVPEGYLDLPGIVEIISQLVRTEGFWKAMHRMVQQHVTSNSRWNEAAEFAQKMKKQYISILTDGAKAECIEVSKIIRCTCSTGR